MISQAAARTCCTQERHVSQIALTDGHTIVPLTQKTRQHPVLKIPSSSTQSMVQRTRMSQQQLKNRAAVLPVASDDTPVYKMARFHDRSPTVVKCLQIHDDSSLLSGNHDLKRPLVLRTPFCHPGSDQEATHQGMEDQRRRPPSRRSRAVTRQWWGNDAPWIKLSF